MKVNKVLYGLYEDEEVLKSAIKKVRSGGFRISNVFTPFPVHGLDHELGLRETRLHSAGLIFGATGTLSALTFITWITTVNYKTNYGGKPYLSLPAWIPITFELTVLFAAVGMTLTYLYLNRIAPGVRPRIIDERTTNHLFAMTFDVDPGISEAKKEEIKKILMDTGAVEVHEKDFTK